jgi:hypothetical protein
MVVSKRGSLNEEVRGFHGFVWMKNGRVVMVGAFFQRR